jgi:hypothetical protein
MGKMGLPMTERILSAHGSLMERFLPMVARFFHKIVVFPINACAERGILGNRRILVG